METASIVIEHKFDRELLEEINMLRSIRLHTAESMLRDLDKTANELISRGLLDKEPHLDLDELRSELTERVTTLRERVEGPDVVYADEISLYVDMLSAEAQ